MRHMLRSRSVDASKQGDTYIGMSIVHYSVRVCNPIFNFSINTSKCMHCREYSHFAEHENECSRHGRCHPAHVRCSEPEFFG